MPKELTVAQMIPLMREAFTDGGVFVMYPGGTSMLPLIRVRLDGVELSPPQNIVRGDMILYRRADGQFVLHRIVGRDADGFVLCGDNQCVYEHGVTERMIEAKVTAILRDGARVPIDDRRYKRYVRRLSFRRALRRLRAFASRVWHGFRGGLL